VKKERVRYLTIRFISSQKITEKDAWFIIANEIKRFFGILGATRIGLYLSFFDVESQGGIFRVSHSAVHQVRSALCFIHSHHSQELYTYSENLTGSLKKAKNEFKTDNSLKKAQKLRKYLLNK
jgi:RNase P/RNase MRP subunit POP5